MLKPSSCNTYIPCHKFPVEVVSLLGHHEPGGYCPSTVTRRVWAGGLIQLDGSESDWSGGRIELCADACHLGTVLSTQTWKIFYGIWSLERPILPTLAIQLERARVTGGTTA
jgi:hypothetical protein